MAAPRVKQQAGYALILMVLGLMSIGGIVIADMAKNARQKVEDQRFAHDKRVLEEAKQALLMYAYRYPQIALEFGAPTIRGPGRLPCPDTDDNGSPNPLINCIDAGVAQVGRFPWNAPGMEFYDARDASGERLWYAVSQNFYNGGPVVNSESFGTISIYDQSGTTIYDGPGNGIAAVIIAPGPPIARDDAPIDGVYEYQQVRRDAAEQADPRNYLDTYTLMDAGPPIVIDTHFDNSLFNNSENDSDDDNFILGPVFNRQENDFVINDRVIVVTTEEVVTMAEKAALHAYREALREYRATVLANLGVDSFPWLDPYDSNDGLDTYDAVVDPATPNPVIGRMPSIFAEYFVDSNPGPSRWIKPELRLSITIDDEVHNMTIPAPALEEIRFEQSGNLVTAIPDGYTITRFFWDGDTAAAPNDRDDVWEMCPTVTFDEEDCNRNAAGDFIGGGASFVELRTREIDITFDGGGAPIVFVFGDRTLTPVEYWSDSPENPDPENHVYIAAEYDDNPSYFANFYYEQDDDFLNSHAEFPLPNNATLTYGNGVADSIKVGLPYYPVLPTWVLDNDWHNRVQVAYSSAMQPGGDGVCTAGVDDCLTLQNTGGIINDKTGLIVISGADINGDVDLGLVDGLDDALQAPDGDNLGVGFGGPLHFSDDLADIFEGENNTLDLTFDYRAANSNDTVLVLD